jgi:hypothetical protein
VPEDLLATRLYDIAVACALVVVAMLIARATEGSTPFLRNG